MSQNPFDRSFADLPATVAIFPLSGAVLLPFTQLQLNIFEPRYLNMTLDALKAERMIGMVQPDATKQTKTPNAVYRTGCAGRITTFSETDDDRLLLVLSGVCRFDISEEIDTIRGYRRVIADWRRFENDMRDRESVDADMPELIAAVKKFLGRRNIEADWESFENTPAARLIDFLAVNLPFDPTGKQALVEAITSEERARTLLALAEMAVPGADSATRH